MARINEVLSDFRSLVAERERTAVETLLQRWMGVESRLEGQLSALALEIDNLRLSDQPVSRGKLMRLRRYQDLLAQAQFELEAYNHWAAGLIGTDQGFYADLGAQHFNAMMGALAPISVQWNRLNIGAANSMIGYAGNGSPLYDLLMKSYPGTAAQIGQTLIDAVAQGWNPRKTAREMRDLMGQNLDRAMVIARTETLRAYRSNVQAGMQQNEDIIDGWIWHSALTLRTCPVCWGLHGSVHPLSEIFQDHVCGRCTAVPLLKPELSSYKILPGDSVLAHKSEAFQRELLGPGRFELYQKGIPLSLMVSWREDDDWGRSPVLKPLSSFEEAANAERG